MARSFVRTAQSARRGVDPRLIVGVLLVLASTAGAYFVISSAYSTVDVYALKSAVIAGDGIDESDLRVVSVNLASMSDTYVRVGQLESGAVVTRTVGAGELLPSGAVGSVKSMNQARLVVTVSDGLALDTPVGTTVDLWATTSDPYSSQPSSSTIVVPGATYARTLEADAYATDGAQRIELLVPRASLRALLAAQGDGSSLIAIPTSAQAG